MKSFLKYLLATIVGIIIVHIIMFFVFIGVIGAIASISSPTVEIKDNTVLKLSFKNAIPGPGFRKSVTKFRPDDAKPGETNRVKQNTRIYQ